MQKRLFKLLSIFLAAVMLLSIPALATGGAGNRVRQTSLLVSDTLQYGNIVSNNASGRQESHYLSFTPGGDIRPIVSAGGHVFGASNINAVIGHAQRQGHNVLGGVNADFFSFQTGIMEGIYISDGRLRSSHQGRSAIFFREDGSAFLGDPTLTFTLTNEGGSNANNAGQQVNVLFYNKFRQPGWLFLYDEHFSNTTRTNAPGREVLFRITEGHMAVGGSVSLEVVSIINSAGAINIPAGHIILSADQRSPHLSELNRFAVGDRVSLRVSSTDTRTASAAWATGGGNILVSGGAHTSGWDPGVAGVHPRTALGIRADGSVILYTVGGRIAGHAAGLTLAELADEMIRLGARYVVNLDGGGSTTFSYRIPGTTNAAVLNRPSGGALRNCSTFILLTSRYQRGGPPVHLQFHPSYADVLAGSLLTPGSFPAQVTATDRGYFPVSTAGLRFSQYIAPANLGVQEEDGFRTASENASGILTIYAENGARGRAHLNLVARANQIEVRINGANVSALTLAAGDTVQLSYHAIAGGHELFASRDMFTTRVTGNVATLDANGRLTATGEAGGRGQVTVTAGGASRTIPLTIAAHFADTDGHWAEDYIGQMRAAGVARGVATPQGTFFRPNQNISRAEFAAMLTRLLGINPANYSLTGREFLDHNQIPNWARPYAAAMFQRGYITGRTVEGGVRFDAESPILRAEAFTILGRLLDIYAPDSVLHRFSDHAQIPNWARPEIARLVSQGLLTGTGGRLLPLDNITRAESATILARIAPNILPAAESLPDTPETDTPEFPDLEDARPPEDDPEIPETDEPEIDPEPEVPEAELDE